MQRNKTLEVEKTVEDEIIIFRLKGRLNSETAPLFEQEIDSLSDVGEGITIDCMELEYVASAGLRAILRLSKMVNAFKKPFRVINVQSQVYEIFEVTGFSDILDLEKV